MSGRAPSQLIESVPIPGGTYRIGADIITEAEAPNPAHVVELSSFRIGRFPVTNAQFQVFVEATHAVAPKPWADHRFDGVDHPVVGVSWDSALAFCRWAGGTLPSEAQWEVAAAGPEGHRFPWGEDEPTERYAHFGEDWNLGGTADVGSHQDGMSPFGCHDMAGNVWEWCLDAWHNDAHTLRTGTDPLVRMDTHVRPLRGGCWRSIEPKLQNAYRNWFHRVAAHITIGFRVCFSDC